MPIKTSIHFASVYAEGTDWRDTAKQVLEEIDSIRTENDGFTLGFLYITDDLAEDATSILNLFKSVTGIEDWVGCVGMGVFANGQCLIGKTAISAMIGKIPEDDFLVMPGTTLGIDQNEKFITSWLNENDPFCAIVHGDPMSEEDPAHDLDALFETTQCFLVGGLSSAAAHHVQYANDAYDNGISGVLFNTSQTILTGLTQGCKPLGPTHTVTRAHENIIMELDHKPAFQVFADDIREDAKKRVEDVTVSGAGGLSRASDLPEEGLAGSDSDVMTQLKDFISPLKDMFEGDIHLAFPIAGVDTQDYLVRSIVSLDPDHGWISVGQNVVDGDHVMLVRRDHASIEADLSKMLLNIRKRFHHDHGEAGPKAGIYISCVGRADTELTQPNRPGNKETDLKDDNAPTNEMELILEIIGDIPMVGYYASGEISNARLYGYTGILILFN